MRYLISILLLLALLFSKAQNVKITGQVFERDSITVLPFAFAVNKNKSVGRVTDANGRFEFNCSMNDTLLFTFTGRIASKIILANYKIQVRDNTLKLSVYLFPKEVQLKEFVVRSFDFSKEERQNYEHYINRPRPSALNSPISALYYEFSRREKSIRKLAELYQGMLQEEIAKQRLPDSKIRELTGNPKLNFELLQQFCPMSYSFIATASEYDLYLSVRSCYKYYKDGY